MLEIPIYKAEASDGLKELIQSNNAIAYVSQLEPADMSNSSMIENIQKAASAIIKDGKIEDLYFTKSILASTSWNKNDDVFSKADTWIARYTPINKPSNIEHNEDKIVGHMIHTWAIDKDSNIIDDDSTIDDLPDFYHLCNAAVIYTHWTKKEMADSVAALIDDIKEGKKFVSMECLFPNFDYAVQDDGGAISAIARNEDSAFLTKHLRVYGGSGVYDGRKVGRLLRSFVFSGKGYVDQPANPDSIIFSDASVINFNLVNGKNPFINKAGVYLSGGRFVCAAKSLPTNNTESKIMSSENELLQTQLAETKAALKTMADAKVELEKKVTDAGIAQYESKIIALEAEIKTLNEKSIASSTTIKAAQDEAISLKAKVDELTKANEELVAKVSKAEADKMRESRISVLVSGGMTKEVAEEKVQKFSNLNDEQFADLASVLTAAKKEMTEDEKKKIADEKAKKDKAKSSEEILENAEANKEVVVSPPPDSKDEELNEVRASLVSFVRNRLGITENEKESE